MSLRACERAQEKQIEKKGRERQRVGVREGISEGIKPKPQDISDLEGEWGENKQRRRKKNEGAGERK